MFCTLGRGPRWGIQTNTPAAPATAPQRPLARPLVEAGSLLFRRAETLEANDGQHLHPWEGRRLLANVVGRISCIECIPSRSCIYAEARRCVDGGVKQSFAWRRVVE